MAYIGRGTDKLSNIEKLDVITFDGSSSYTLQKNSVNFTPNSANSLQISIDGVVQAGNFSVSGSTIDFGVAIPSTSTNDFIFHYGTGLVTTVADGAITDAKLANSVITGQTEDTTPADDDLILVYDTSATSLKKVQKSNFAGGGITEIDQWRLNANVTSTLTPITSNLERVDTTGQGYLGTGMTQSSGIFTFPSTGIWLILVQANVYTTNFNYAGVNTEVTTNNSTYNLHATAKARDVGSSGFRGHVFSQTLVDVTDTSNVKVRFSSVDSASGVEIEGLTTYNATSFTFIRIGDT
jgi:hypothetical protein